MTSVWRELKRRNVVRVGLAYTVVSWLILQLTDVLISLLSIPDLVGRLVVLVLVIGFPGKEAFWFANPQGKAGYWKKHLALAVVDNGVPVINLNELEWIRGEIFANQYLTERIARIDPDTTVLTEQMRSALSQHYDIGFDSVMASLYRNGRDSVAWHADRIGQTEKNPLVVIVSLGSPRDLLLRPKGGGTSTRITMNPGDLLVMGGATQHRWEHCIPKRAHAAPRMSVTFRHNPEPFLTGETFAYVT